MFKKLALALDASVVALGKATLDVANVLLGTQEEPEKEPDMETKLATRREELHAMQHEIVSIRGSIDHLANAGRDVRHLQANLDELVAAYEIQKAAYTSVADAHSQARNAASLQNVEASAHAGLAALSKSLNVTKE